MRTIFRHALGKCCLLPMTILLLNACTLAKVEVNVVGSRTALENQVMGSYEALDEDLQQVASVRAIDPTGKIKEPPPQTREKDEALRATQTIQFRQDDLNCLKELGWVGEKRDGEIAALPYDREKSLKAASKELRDFGERIKDGEVTEIVTQINAARLVVWKRLIETNASLKEEDLPKIREIFGKLNYESARPGEMLQSETDPTRFEPKLEPVAAK